MNKFEVFQKKCLKWILSEQELSYSNEVYIRKCKQVNILPLFCRFNLNDMNLFHKIVYKTIPINMSDYLTLYKEIHFARQFGLGLGPRVWFFFLTSYTNTNFDMIINIILI